VNGFALLAALTVFVHLLFVVFAVTGGLLALRWPRIVWLHLPAAAWAAFVELSGRLCPLTPLEHALRERGGLAPYSGDFVAHYIFPVLYPAGLTREMQLWIGLAVVAGNLAAYALVLRRRRAGVSRASGVR
jgi:hypothetical protein